MKSNIPQTNIPKLTMLMLKMNIVGPDIKSPQDLCNFPLCQESTSVKQLFFGQVQGRICMPENIGKFEHNNNDDDDDHNNNNNNAKALSVLCHLVPWFPRKPPHASALKTHRLSTNHRNPQAGNNRFWMALIILW